MTAIILLGMYDSAAGRPNTEIRCSGGGSITVTYKSKPIRLVVTIYEADDGSVASFAITNATQFHQTHALLQKSLNPQYEGGEVLDGFDDKGFTATLRFRGGVTWNNDDEAYIVYVYIYSRFARAIIILTEQEARSLQRALIRQGF